MNDVLNRIQDYMENGGLMNPEMMEHMKVRDLIMECRYQITLLRKDNTQANLLNQKMREGLEAAIRELDRVTVVKDGHPNVSHGLMHNLRKALESVVKEGEE